METIKKEQHYVIRWAKLGAVVGFASAVGGLAQKFVTQLVHGLFQ